MPHSSRFWDKIARKYAKSPIADEAAYKRKLEMTRSYFTPDMAVLEIGCGTGSTALLHAMHVKQIHAVDISEVMLEIARDKARYAGITNISFECADIDDVTPHEGGYDMVLALSLLHLLENRAADIARISAMLKPGGLFISSTACLGDWMRVFKLIGPIGQFLGFIPLVRVFTAEELENSVTDSGFTIEQRWNPGPKKAHFIVARKKS